MIDAELTAYAGEFRDAALSGASSDRMCAALSWPLAAALNTLGIKAQLIETVFEENRNHVFIRMVDSRVLDVTADQFNERYHRPIFSSVYLGAPVDGIHEGGTLSDDRVGWLGLATEMVRLTPGLPAKEWGELVHVALMTGGPDDLAVALAKGRSARPDKNRRS